MKKISENPEFSRVLEGLESMDALLGFVEKAIPGAFPPEKLALTREQITKLREQSKIFHLPDSFNALFISKGWLAYESLSLEVMTDAVKLGRMGDIEKAEQCLVEYYSAENLSWMFLRLKGTSNFTADYDSSN